MPSITLPPIPLPTSEGIRALRGCPTLVRTVSSWSVRTTRYAVPIRYEMFPLRWAFPCKLMFSRKPTAPKQTAAAALDDMACAAAFARQAERPSWLTAVAVAVTVAVLIAVVVASWRGNLWGFRPVVFLMPAGALFLVFSHWLSVSAACPNCRRDVRTGLRVRCHRCREPLTNQRCEPCDVDFGWGAGLRGSDAYGNSLPIRYCPGCGAYVNSDLTVDTSPDDNRPFLSAPNP